MLTEPHHYELVFDATGDGNRLWEVPAFGLLLVAAGIGFVLYELRWRPPSQKSHRRLAWFYLAFTVLWTAAAAGKTYHEYATFARAVREGTVRYVEGPVRNFVPTPAAGRSLERFEVDGRQFSYGDGILTGGFNKTSRRGGPIRAGRQVRVGYVGDVIVRLEVER